MVITIITDCYDENSKGRQITRVGSLFKCPISFIGVSSDLEASGNLIDSLDALNNKEGIILTNVARRNKEAKKWENGSPFAYFWYKKILIIASIDGYILSLIKKLNIANSVNVLDIRTVVDILIVKKLIPKEEKEDLINTQFRSFNFLPYIGKFLFKYKKIISKNLDIKEILSVPAAVWAIDNFGNCKTTIFEKEIVKKQKIDIKIENLSFYSKLKDVPDNTAAIIAGSSGMKNNRFLEIVIQGGNAAKQLNLSIGKKI